MKNSEREKNRIVEKQLWLHCSTHNLDYPASAECPMCRKQIK